MGSILEMLFIINHKKLIMSILIHLEIRKLGVKVNSSLFAGDVGYIVTGSADGQSVENRIPPNEGLYFVHRVDENM